MQIQPLVQFSWIYLIAACAALLLSFLLYRETQAPISNKLRLFLWVIRLTFILILFMMGIAPVWNFVQEKELKPQVVVLEDVSQSVEHGNQTALLRELQSPLESAMHQNGFALNWYSFADGIDGASHTTDFQKTFRAIINQYRGKNLQGIILASDGQDNGQQSCIPLLMQEKIPVFTLGMGEEVSEQNAKITQIMAPNYAFLQEEYTIRVRVQAQNFDGENAVVSLFEEGKKVDEQSIVLDAAFAENEVSFQIQPQLTGQRRFTARLELANPDAVPADNQKDFLMDIKQDKVRVFCFAQAVGPDVAAVLRFLRKQQDIETVEFIRAGSRYLRHQTSGHPQLPDQETVFDCAVLFFEDGQTLSASETNYLQMLLTNVNCLVIGAIPTALETKLPLQRSNIKDQESAYVEWVKPYHNTLSFLENAPSLTPIKAYFYEANPQAKILAFAQLPSHNPVVALQETTNKIMQWACKGTFLWQNENAFLEKFLDSIIRWLRVQEKVRGLSLQLSSQSLPLGEPLLLQAQVYDESLRPRPHAEIKAEFFRNDSLAQTAFFETQGDGQFTLNTSQLAAGDYRVKVSASEDGQLLGKQENRFVIASFSPEQAVLGLNRKVLEQMVSVSGGDMLDWEKVDDWPQKIPNHTQKIVIEKTFDFRNSRWILLLLLVLFASELFLRKRKGLR